MEKTVDVLAAAVVAQGVRIVKVKRKKCHKQRVSKRTPFIVSTTQKLYNKNFVING